MQSIFLLKQATQLKQIGLVLTMKVSVDVKIWNKIIWFLVLKKGDLFFWYVKVDKLWLW